MKNLKRYCNVLLLMTVSAALSLSGCREVNDTLYLKYVDIPSEGWQTYQPVCFDPAAADTLWLGKPMILEMHVRNACAERIYPVGRLDRNTTGVLLLTNDGDLASKLTHPKYVKKKIYHVWTDREISEDDMQRIADGIELDDGEIHADAISYVSDERNQAGIEIHSGRNRIVRRIFEHLGYRVTKLDRVYFAGLTKKNLPRGRWRYLTQEEVNILRQGAFE